MLDHLSGGRLDIGVGTGVSPHEFAAIGVDFPSAREAFEEIFAILYQGLSQDRLDHRGSRFRFDGLKMVMRPLQRPLPPLWYGLRTDYGHALAARYGMNVVTLGGDDRIATIDRPLSHGLARRTGGPAPHRHAHGRAAHRRHARAVRRRQRRRSRTHRAPRLSAMVRQSGVAVEGERRLSADRTVAGFRYRAGLGCAGVRQPRYRAARSWRRRRESCGFNYLVLQLAFGSFGHAHEMRSLALFRDEVMPRLQA